MANTNNHLQTPQEMQNAGFDPVTNTPAAIGLGYDGVNLQRQMASCLAMKKTVVGSVTYLAFAAPGTAQSTAKWQVRKIDETSGSVITWCDGNASFDNIATDLTLLTYS